MFEIKKLGERTYYIPNATNIGLYLENESDVWLIDTGIDADTGKKILRLTAERGWTVKGIICTHTHADHVGGNKVIKDRTDCVVLAHGAEKSIGESTFLNTTAVFGGKPYGELMNKFFYSEPFGTVAELAGNLPDGLEYIELPGHTFDMVGIRTPDDVYFLADSLVSEVTITKYHVFYLYDIARQYETLSYLRNLSGENKKNGVPAVYVPSHCEAMQDMDSLIELNVNKLTEIKELVAAEIKSPKTLEGVVQAVFAHYGLRMNATQHTLLTSTLRSFLSYLSNEGLAEIYFEDNLLFYRAV